MMRGLEFSNPADAARCAERAVQERIVIECCGPRDEVLKIMAPLNIDVELFSSALTQLGYIVDAVLGSDETVPRLERDNAALDPHNHCGDPIAGAELLHGVTDMEFDCLLGDA